MKKISIVVPCYNESRSLPAFFLRMNELILLASEYSFEIIFVDDGSLDDTSSILLSACGLYSWLNVLVLTRNFGKEAALTAGLDSATGDAIIFMDADLQHPPEVVHQFLAYWESGAAVVAAKRVSRQTDGKIYKYLAESFYRLHNRMSDVALPEGVGDFRLIDRRVADQLKLLRESRRFMKGLFSWVGYKPVFVEYDVAPRLEGRSAFNKWRSWNLAIEGITSFSTVPLRIWSYFGAVVLVLGLFYSGVIVFDALVHGVLVPGYVTLLTAVVIFGGIQLIGLGVLGEYIGRIYMEVKGRPSYLIAQKAQGGEIVSGCEIKLDKF